MIFKNKAILTLTTLATLSACQPACAMNGTSPLSLVNIWQAIEDGNIAQVRKLAGEKNFKINETEERHNTPLLWACFLWATCSNNPEIIKELLKHPDVNVNQVDECDKTPLYFVCFRSNLDLVKLLLNKGADVNKASNKSWTPLHHACFNDNLEIVKLLLAYGAQNKPLKNNITPIYFACLNDNIEIVKLLLEHSAIVDNKSLDIAKNKAQKGHPKMLQYLLLARNYDDATNKKEDELFEKFKKIIPAKLENFSFHTKQENEPIKQETNFAKKKAKKVVIIECEYEDEQEENMQKDKMEL